MVAHPAVQGVALTGSERAGSSVAALAGKHLKKCILELGSRTRPYGQNQSRAVSPRDDSSCRMRWATGSSPSWANDAAPCNRVIRWMQTPHWGHYRRSKRHESSSSRCRTLCVRAPGWSRAGRAAREPRTQRYERIRRCHCSHRRDPEMRAFSEELFGPVAVVYRVSDVDEAVSLVNSSRYGLGATVIGRDEKPAQQVAERIETGMVWINEPTGTDPDLPFGGIKNSGFGRELSDLGILEFVNRKLIRSV